jgi:uncharacterized protein (TIGR03067 family)
MRGAWVNHFTLAPMEANVFHNFLSSLVLTVVAAFAAAGVMSAEMPVPDSETLEIRLPVNAPPRMASVFSRLQGHWRFSKIIEDGQERSLTYDLSVDIAGNQVIYVSSDRRRLGSVLLIDGQQNHCDLVNVIENANDAATAQCGTPIPGIYSLEGNRLTFCLNLKGTERPKNFTAAAGSGHRLSVLERVADQE